MRGHCDEQRVAESLLHAKWQLAELRPKLVAGICDGGLIAGLLASPVFASDAILADGSSTVFPITQEAAKRSKLAVDNRFSGTTAGFRRFCAGETDISNASRPINREEMASCALAHAAVITFALRETNSPRLQAKVASVDVGEGGSNDSVSGGGGVRSVARVVLATVQRDPLAPLSSVKKLFMSGKAVAWLSISVVAAEMIDRTHHLRVLVAFDRLGWVSRASCPTNPQLCFMIV